MKSGLEGRNKRESTQGIQAREACLNEVRPRRPEQTGLIWVQPCGAMDWVSMKSGLEGRNKQGASGAALCWLCSVSMKSGLEGRNKRVAGVTSCA